MFFLELEVNLPNKAVSSAPSNRITVEARPNSKPERWYSIRIRSSMSSYIITIEVPSVRMVSKNETGLTFFKSVLALVVKVFKVWVSS